MTDQAIFLFSGGALTPMTEAPYENEPILQKALSDYPDLIAGAATTGEGGRLLLIRREMPVPGPSGTSSLSLDHLFVDSTGMPVLVEVKRSSDTRARREVVAQMLDYAANAVAYWPVERLRALVDEAAATKNLDPSDLLQQALGIDEEPDRYWRTVEDNLRAGRVRLIFLADRLPAELVRIIEFLNEQMRDTEVLGIELPQYTGSGEAVIYVPRVVGRTSTAVDTKRGASPGTRWTRESLLQSAHENCTAAETALVVRLLDHVSARHGRFSWGTGSTAGVTGWYQVNGVDTPVWNLNLGGASGRGHFYFIFAEYASRHPDRIDAYGATIGQMPTLAQKVAASEGNGWKGWVGLPLTEATEVADEVIQGVESALQ